MKSATVFIVEDDLVSAQYLREILETEGLEVIGTANNARKALEMLKNRCADIVLMDIILEGPMSGSEAAIILKQRYSQCQIIFITAYADEEMIEYALDAKASAYLMKPYREKEILATIQMVLNQNRPKHAEPETEIYLKDDLLFDTQKHLLRRGQHIIPLSEKKLRLIEILVKNRNSIVSNEQLYLYIWGEPMSDGSLRSLISRFKDNIGEDIITNANGLGYMVMA